MYITIEPIVLAREQVARGEARASGGLQARNENHHQEVKRGRVEFGCLTDFQINQKKGTSGLPFSASASHQSIDHVVHVCLKACLLLAVSHVVI